MNLRLEDLVSGKEAARLLGVSRQRLLQLKQANRLCPIVLPGSRDYLYRREDVLRQRDHADRYKEAVAAGYQPVLRSKDDVWEMMSRIGGDDAGSD